MNRKTKENRPPTGALEPVGSRKNAILAHMLACRLKKYFDTPTSLTYLARLIYWPYGEDALQDALRTLWMETGEHERLAARLATFEAIEREIEQEPYTPVTQR